MQKKKDFTWIIMAMILILLPACTIVTSTDESDLRANNDYVYAVGYYGFRPYWENPYYDHPIPVRSLH